MTDRDLLEAAAKAAGIWNESDPWNGMLKANGQYWNPLGDDGDALRLAVTLKMDVDITGDTAWAMAEADMHAGHAEVLGSDNVAATRRAIVRAAAAIGLTPNV